MVVVFTILICIQVSEAVENCHISGIDTTHNLIQHTTFPHNPPNKPSMKLTVDFSPIQKKIFQSKFCESSRKVCRIMQQSPSQNFPNTDSSIWLGRKFSISQILSPGICPTSVSKNSSQLRGGRSSASSHRFWLVGRRGRWHYSKGGSQGKVL